MCVDHSKKVIIYLIFVSFNYYTHFLYKHSDISRWMVWATAPGENGTQECSPRVSFDMGRPAQELSWNALRWRWGHTPSLGVQGMGFLGETRHVCFVGMCIYCILVYAYITAHDWTKKISTDIWTSCILAMAPRRTALLCLRVSVECIDADIPTAEGRSERWIPVLLITGEVPFDSLVHWGYTRGIQGLWGI